MSAFTERGRHVCESGRIEYHWPPEGRFSLMWARLTAAFPDEVERAEVACLIEAWRDESSTLVAVIEDGVTYDVEPDWSLPAGWLANPGGVA